MYSIGEFSRISGLTIKTLRFYHERGLLEPAAVDPQSGYRYYDARSLELAYAIAALRKLEFSLDDIVVILAECGDDQDTIDYLESHKRLLGEKLQHYRDLVDRIDRVIVHEREARETMKMHHESYEIEERFIDAQLVAGVRMKGKYSDCGIGFAKLGKRVGRYAKGKPLCLYYDGEYREDDADFEPCFPIRKEVTVDEVNVHSLPGVRCVTLIHRGPYETLSRSYARIMEYAKQKGYEIDLPTREVYLKGPGMIFKGNPKKYLTEIQLPIKDGA